MKGQGGASCSRLATLAEYFVNLFDKRLDAPPLALHWLLYAFNTTGNGLGIAKVR